MPGWHLPLSCSHPRCMTVAPQLVSSALWNRPQSYAPTRTGPTFTACGCAPASSSGSSAFALTLPAAPYIKSFGLEQCGRLADAEEEAARGDRIDGSDAWAHHCMAHTLYFQVRLRECEEYMLARAHAWTDICSFMYTHNWWHVALAQVEQGEPAAVGWPKGVFPPHTTTHHPSPLGLSPPADRLKDAHATFSRHVWGVNKDDSEDQFGACSMLWRFSLHQFAATGASALQRGLSPADALAEAGRGRAASEQEDSALIQDAAAHVRSSGVSRKRLVPLLDATVRCARADPLVAARAISHTRRGCDWFARSCGRSWPQGRGVRPVQCCRTAWRWRKTPRGREETGCAPMQPRSCALSPCTPRPRAAAHRATAGMGTVAWTGRRLCAARPRARALRT